MITLGLGLIAAFCWGAHDIGVRYLSQSVPLLAALFVVLLAGAGYQVAWISLGDDWVVPPQNALFFAVAAGIGFLIADLGIYFALQRGPVRIVAPLVASYPVLSLGVAIWQGAEVAIWQWLAVCLIVVGVAATAGLGPRDDTAKIPPRGPTIALSLMAAAGFAVTFALGQHATALGASAAGHLVTRMTTLAALVGIMLFANQTFWPGTRALMILIVLGVLDAVALQSVLSAGGMPHPEYASVASSVFGLLTVILAWIFLREKMTKWQWVGCLLAFAGIGVLAI